MNNLYEALDVCLNEIEQGADVDAVLLTYPEFAEELRPILEASVKAKSMSVPVPSQEIIRRNRVKVLQHAFEMREAKNAPISRRIWSVPLRRALVSLVIITIMFLSSTGLVRASSNTLPGDNLYPVKRTWEDVLVFFTVDPTKRGELELEHENERLDEVHELFTEGRSANVDFAGYITRQTGDEWRVSGITVLISSQTSLPDKEIGVGAAVRVKGQVQNSSIVAAEEIELLPPGYSLPEVIDDELEMEAGGNEEDESAKPSETDALPNSDDSISTPELHVEDEEFEGVVTSRENEFLVVNGILMDIGSAEIKGTPGVGVVAKAKGYYDTNGIFIVTKVEFKTDGPGGSGSDDDNAINNDVNDNGDDGSNGNTNSNDNSNDDNSNDTGDHSGSGGGGGD